MSTLKYYLFESLIILTVLIAVGVFYVQFMHQEPELPSSDMNEIKVENAQTSALSDFETIKHNQAPKDLLTEQASIILRLDGSNTIGEKLAPTLAAAYLQQIGANGIVIKQLERENEVQVIGYLAHLNRVVAIEIKAHGSSTGFESLIADSTDIAMSSRNIKHSENLDLLLKQGDMTKPESEHIIALDGLAIIKHPRNPIAVLTVNQLAKIFSGEIKNWSELGGINSKINLYARDDKSGTYDTFKSLVLDKYSKPLLSTAGRYESSEQLVSDVLNDPAGIGFTGLAYAEEDVMVAVAAEPGLSAIKPKQFSISSEDYALSRRLFLYANKSKSSNRHIGDFIEFAVSNYGQQMVESASFIPQKVTTHLALVNKDHPTQYQQMALSGERVSVTFRMRADRAEIDNKSIQDIEHLTAFLKQTPYEKITLVAFSAQETGEQEDKNRAYIRTKLLAFELNQRGVKNVEIIAMGTQLPIDSNDSDLGRYRNNRTEIWLINNNKES